MPPISCGRTAELARASIYQRGQCTLRVFLLLEGQLWLLPREDTGACFKERLYPPGKDRDQGPVDATSQAWAGPPGCAAEGPGNGPVLQYLKDGFTLPPAPSNPSLHQIILRDQLFVSSKGALFATTASGCEQPIMRCPRCSHVGDCSASSLEATGYKFFWTKSPTFSKPLARHGGTCVHGLVHTQPSVCVSGDPSKSLSR